ncbi:MAG: hypothetical protein Q7R81_02165 [Candidatus Peregrinibacteria bacterium]|nr:hypothetical protein [Candidatus Peregrinibacteria bacterium]
MTKQNLLKYAGSVGACALIIFGVANVSSPADWLAVVTANAKVVISVPTANPRVTSPIDVEFKVEANTGIQYIYIEAEGRSTTTKKRVIVPVTIIECAVGTCGGPGVFVEDEERETFSQTIPGEGSVVVSQRVVRSTVALSANITGLEPGNAFIIVRIESTPNRNGNRYRARDKARIRLQAPPTTPQPIP